MSPILIFFGDMYFINLATYVFSACIFLFLLYVDKKWPHITPLVWLFIATNLVLNTVFTITLGLYAGVDEKMLIPQLLNLLFTTSLVMLPVIFAYDEFKVLNEKPTTLLRVTTVLTLVIILVVEMLLAITVQI